MLNLRLNNQQFSSKSGFNRIFWVLILFLFLAQIAPAVQMSRARMAREIDRFLTRQFKPGKPGIAVLAVMNNRVVLRKGYGMANLEHGIRMSPEHVFRIGSITKQFTAAAIMMLAEEGKLKVSDPIDKYLDKYPTHGHTITIEHLLNHTSGIRSYTGMTEFWEKHMRLDMTVEELIDFFKKEPMDFQPGERWLYNNSGYFLLGAIIEKVSGKSYPEFIRKRIFQPLGMNNSYYGSHLTIIPHRTAGYQKTKKGFDNCNFMSMKLPYAAGSLLSTVDDLYTWNRALASGRVVSESSLGKMITPTRLNNGKVQNYGYGLGVSDFFGSRLIGHGGGINGFSTYAMRIADKGIFVVVLINCPGMEPAPTFISQWIAALLMGKPLIEKKPVQVADEILESYVGIYKIAEGDYREVIKEGNRLFTQRGGGLKYQIFPESSNRFYYKLSFSRLNFVCDKDGRVIKMVMQRPEGGEEAVRGDKKDEIESPAVSPYSELTGEYGEKEGFKMKIFETGGKLMAQGSGQQPLGISIEKKDIYTNKDANIRLEFQRDKKGNITGFFLYQNGLKIIMDRN